MIAMRDCCKKSFFFTQFRIQLASRHNVREKNSCLLLITNIMKKYLVTMRDRCKKIPFHSISPTIRFKAQC